MDVKKEVKVGDAVPYTSCYGYAKRKFQIIDTETTGVIGYVKEEIVLDESGQEIGKTFYTRSFCRPSGAKRFYSSPEALLIAFGYKIARIAPVKKTRVKATPAQAKAKWPLRAKKPAGRVKKAA